MLKQGYSLPPRADILPLLYYNISIDICTALFCRFCKAFRFQLYIITMNKLASSVSATEALAKEHREHRNEPLAFTVSGFFYA